MISFLCLQQCIDCVFNLPLNERQSLVEAKQGVDAIINHSNFCRGEKESPARSPVCIRETPVTGERNLPRRQKSKVRPWPQFE